MSFMFDCILDTFLINKLYCKLLVPDVIRGQGFLVVFVSWCKMIILLIVLVALWCLLMHNGLVLIFENITITKLIVSLCTMSFPCYSILGQTSHQLLPMTRIFLFLKPFHNGYDDKYFFRHIDKKENVLLSNLDLHCV